MRESQLVMLVDSIYVAAESPYQWEALLCRMNDLLASDVTFFTYQNLDDLTGSIGPTAKADPAFVRSYADYYAIRNPFLQQPELLTTGFVAKGESLYSIERLLRTEFYADWLRPQHLLYSLGGTVLREGAETAFVTFIRSRKGGAFPDEHETLLRLLMPHLQRALRLHERLSMIRLQLGAAERVLDHLPQGVLLIGADGTILHANATARQIIDRKDGVVVSGGRLTALSASEAAILDSLIHSASQAPALTLPAGGMMSITRSGQQRPYHIFIAAMREPEALFGHPHSVVGVFISDPDIAAPDGSDRLQKLFDLTPAEARVAASLMKGKSVDEIAFESNISPHTVRSHVKQIHSKTRTNRQGELMRLLLLSGATIREE